MWTIFKVFIGFVTILFLCNVLGFFGPEVCGILAPQPGIKHTCSALKSKALTAGPQGKTLICFIY